MVCWIMLCLPWIVNKLLVLLFHMVPLFQYLNRIIQKASTFGAYRQIFPKFDVVCALVNCSYYWLKSRVAFTEKGPAWWLAWSALHTSGMVKHGLTFLKLIGLLTPNCLGPRVGKSLYSVMKETGCYYRQGSLTFLYLNVSSSYLIFAKLCSVDPQKKKLSSVPFIYQERKSTLGQFYVCQGRWTLGSLGLGSVARSLGPSSLARLILCRRLGWREEKD